MWSWLRGSAVRGRGPHVEGVSDPSCPATPPPGDPWPGRAARRGPRQGSGGGAAALASARAAREDASSTPAVVQEAAPSEPSQGHARKRPAFVARSLRFTAALSGGAGVAALCLRALRLPLSKVTLRLRCWGLRTPPPPRRPRPRRGRGQGERGWKP